uniref:PiggyBac transposable element-derived protein 4 n=3 Tax=Lygus hesperus TaxID=30085 RepID=A0A0A9W0B8_LYGHE
MEPGPSSRDPILHPDGEDVPSRSRTGISSTSARRSLQLDDDVVRTPKKRKKMKTPSDKFFLCDTSDEAIRAILDQLLSSDEESSEDEGGTTIQSPGSSTSTPTAMGAGQSHVIPIFDVSAFPLPASQVSPGVSADQLTPSSPRSSTDLPSTYPGHSTPHSSSVTPTFQVPTYARTTPVSPPPPGDSYLKKLPNGNEPKDFFDLLFTEELFQLVVQETNSFSEELFLRQGDLPRARITDWKDTSVEEIKTFLGLYFHMGNIPLHMQQEYWSRNEMFNLPFFRKHMARDRWLLLQQAFHLAPNPQEEDPKPDDPFFKLRPIVVYFHETMESIINPGKITCGDESMAPWRGRISFRQYLPMKSHKYGIKLYMLTEPDGLLHRFIVYVGSADAEVGGQGHAKNVVMKLMDGLLEEGRAIYLDNFHNSVDLAASLLEEKTHVTGTLSADRKHNPKEVVTKKLKKGEVVQRWSPKGICVSKWKDKRDVLTISTEFSPELIEAPTRRGTKVKPDVVVQYNKCMGGIDRLDQLLSYYILHKRTLRWYKKLAFHIIELMLLNAYLLYRRFSLSPKKVSLHYFRLAIVQYLCGEGPSPSSTNLPSRSQQLINSKHFPAIHESAGSRKKRIRCRECSKTKVAKHVSTFCPGCEDQPGLCIQDCFLNYHKEKGFIFLK